MTQKNNHCQGFQKVSMVSRVQEQGRERERKNLKLQNSAKKKKKSKNAPQKTLRKISRMCTLVNLIYFPSFGQGSHGLASIATGSEDIGPRGR